MSPPPQILTHIQKSENITCFDVKWIPSSARFVVLGSYPRGTGALKVYELNGNEIQLKNEIEKPKSFKCGTFGGSSIQQRHLATGDFDGNLQIWDLENEKTPVFSAKAHKSIINAIDGIGGLKGNGAPEVVTAGRDGCVKVWDPREREPVATMEPAAGIEARDCWTVSFGNSFSNEDRCLCAGFDNGDIKLFDLKTMKMRWEKNVKSGVCGIEFNRADIEMDKMIATTLDAKYYMFDMGMQNSKKTDFPSITKTTQKGTIWTVKHTPHNRDVFVTTGGSGSICLWKYSSPVNSDKDVKSGKDKQVLGSIELLKEATISSQPISSFDWNSDKQGLAVCTSFDQSVRVLIITKLHLL